MENKQEIIDLKKYLSKEKGKKIDIEKDFNYFNPFFLLIGIILIFVFYLQIKNGLFDLGENIDLNNFTFKYSNYSKSGNVFGIFTSIFLHGGVEHLISNLIFFYIFSLIIYRLFGFYKSIVLFLITGILAGIPSYLYNGVPSIGASGAIFGLFGISTIFYFTYKNKLEDNLGDIFGVLIFLVIIQIFSGYTSPQIDNKAHIFGFLSGLILGYIFIKSGFLNLEKNSKRKKIL